MVIRHKELLPDIQLLKQYEGHNGHLWSERKNYHMVARPEVGQRPKGKTDGMVWFQEIFQEVVPIWKLLWKENKIVLRVKTWTNDNVGSYK